MSKTRAYDTAEYLDTPEMIAEYLTEASETGDATFIAKAISTVARARGMASVADAAGVSREQLYRALGGEAGTDIVTIRKVLAGLGVKPGLADKTDAA